MTDLTRMVIRALLLPSFMVAAAILVKGYSSTGDGFSAGVVAALAILLQYVGFSHEEVARWLPVHRAFELAFGGLLLAFLVVFTPVLFGGAPVTHFPPPGARVVHLGTLELHTALLFDLGVFALVVGFSVHLVDRTMSESRREQP